MEDIDALNAKSLAVIGLIYCFVNLTASKINQQMEITITAKLRQNPIDVYGEKKKVRYEIIERKINQKEKIGLYL